MRLTDKQVDQIIDALDGFLQNQSAELRLFGSRVQDQLKGGDIDLLILTERQKTASQLLEKKHYILAQIKKNLGDQKIDLTIAAHNDLQSDAFLKMIFPQSVLLKKW